VQARLAEAYRATGRHERARQLYLRELRVDPGDIDTLLDLGSLLVEMNRCVEAGEKFRRVLEIEPDNADAHFELGDLSERQGQTNRAIVHFDVVLRLDADYHGARRRLASLLLRRAGRGDADAARALLARERGEFERSPEDYGPGDTEDLGKLLMDSGAAAEAVAVLRALTRLQPDRARPRHLLSVALFESGNRDAGMDEARRVLKIDPRFVPAMHNLAMACVRGRQWRRARYWLDQARTVDPDDASLRRLRLALALHALSEAASWVYCFLVRRRPR
jgi:tetratricopeptide (TPR) repeat protein